MKMIYAIIQPQDADNVIEILNQHSFMVTKLSSTGGFLRKGNATLMVGTPKEKVDEVLQILKAECGKRKQMMCTLPYAETPIVASSTMVPVEVGGATVFIVDVERFEKI